MTQLSRVLAWTSAAAMLAAWILIAVLGDQMWWTLPLLYGPRWVMAGLFLGLLPALLFAFRSALAAALLMTPLFLFGVLGFRMPLGSEEAPRDYTFRVLEMNAAGARGESSLAAIRAEITRLDPQVVVVAECGRYVQAALRELEGWWADATVSGLCFATRLPLLGLETRHPRDFWEMNGSGAISRALVETPAGVVRIGLVHLETPREALQEFMDISRIPSLGDFTRANMELRELESRVAREWIFAGEPLPTVVAGDFNLPVESAIYRRYWSDLDNAFSRAGLGLGSTKDTDFWGSRIDHILSTGEIVALRAGIGNSIGSDHRPLYADLSMSSPF